MTFVNTIADRVLALDLVKRHEPLLGPMTIEREVDDELLKKAGKLLAVMYTQEWLHANDSRRPHADQVKIREGVYVIQNMLKTPGGLVRVTVIKEDETLCDVHISGDFFFHPANLLPELEHALNGIPADAESVKAAIEKFYAAQSIVSPGVQPADFAAALFPVAAWRSSKFLWMTKQSSTNINIGF